MSRIFQRGLVPALVWSAALAAPLSAVTLPGDSPLQDRVFRHARLYVPSLDRALGDLEPELSAALERDLDALGAPSTGALFDWRAGRLSTLLPSQPLIPGDGVGNDLRWSEAGAGRPGDEEARLAIRDALSAYVEAHRQELRIDPSELGEPSIGIFEQGGMVQVHVPRAMGGIPVRDSGLTAVISHGNLVLLGLQTWGDVRVDTTPAVAPEGARASIAEHLRPFAVTRYRQPERLEIVALARGEDLASVVAGAGYDYRLVWVLEPDVEADMGRWEALVDAASGELIAFQDTNQYAARRAMGGVYPLSNDQRPPDGIEQPGWPMPFANITSGSPTVFTTTGGIVPACIAGNMATTLSGPFMRMSDACGAINETSAGDIDMGVSAGDDCTVPAGHSVGDTHSSRSGFYELNRIKEQARAYLPGNAWLQAQLTANMNINNVCNAFWNGSTVNFYRSGSGCGNTGEIAAIFDHEWGHGLDDNGANGNISNPGESIADIHATLRLDNSCVGRGFFLSQVCGGYGDPCTGTPATGCTGVRDADFANHVSGLPHGITWIQSNCSGGSGPCGREVHCEGQIVSEVGWDLQFRDLRAAPFNFDESTALELTTRIFYLGAETVTNWYTCAANCQATGTCGCGATGGYLLMLAADDDNGNVNDGTPHMSAIRAAFERHEIHCATQTVTNSGCAGGPTAAPVLTAVATAGGANLSWTSVAGASAYAVYRTEGVSGCNLGKVKIGQTSGTTFSDSGLLGGRQYFYGVLPVGSNSSCFGRMSACASATALANTDPCGNAVTLSFVAAASTVPEIPANAPAVVTLATQNGLPTTATASASFATANGTATAGSDYTASSGTVSFPSGTPNGATQTLNVPILGDALDEPNETFTLGLSNPVGAGLGAITTHTVTITDDDAAPSVSIGDVTVTEGNAGTTTAAFTLTLSAASGQAVTLNFATANGTASAGSDYVAASGTVSFAPGATTQTLNVTVNGDIIDEPDETFLVNLTNPTNATIADGQGVGTITDDDAPAALSVNDVAVTEGNAGTVTATFTVSLSPVSGQIVTLSFATADGTAGAGSDYAAASGSLTFAPGTTSQAVSVSVNGDTLDEPNETFFVNLSGATNATITDGQGVGTITDDDAAAALSIGDVTVAEGNSGTSVASFTVTLSPVSGQSVSVDFATADGSATAGSDYVATSGSLSFPPGTTARTVDVTVNGDATTEPDETLLVNVSNPTNATIADGQGVGTISNDDSVPSLSIVDTSVTEGDAGTVNAAFSVTLSAVQSQPVTVDFATADGTASAGSDYVAQSGSLSFAPGATTGTIDVTVDGDLLDEPDETFLVDLTNPTNATVADGQGVGSIGDDDAAPVLSIADASGREGPNGATTPVTFTLSLSAPSGQTVSVGYGTSDGTASAGTDYVAASGSLSFSPGATTGALSVTVNGDDLREADETFLVDLTGPVNAGIGDGQAVGTIANDDGWPELSHGQAILTSLQAQPGPVPDADSYRLRQKPGASYEAVLDAASGDLGPTGPTLQRIASDGVTVVDDSVAASGGSSRSLRWETAGSATVDDETLRVTAPTCGTGCGPEDVYRVRLYDTTAVISRFNNSATQVTVMVLQNAGPDPVTGTIRFWGSSGTLLASQSFSTVPHGTLVLNTAGVPGVSGQSGSITVASDVAYGALAGKAVAVEPATGFTFDTPLTFRPR